MTSKNVLNKAAQKQEQALLLIADGQKHTSMDISFRCRISDPRSTIRDIRKLGSEVKDEWVEIDGTRFKRYWINASPYGAIIMEAKKSLNNDK